MYATANDGIVLDAARRVRIATRGSGSTAVWKSWIDKAAPRGDFGNDEWTSMQCIEAASTLEATVPVERAMRT